MNMRQIEGFCLLAKTLNFSKAAEKMYITQPAFSRMIESLENELGCKLIVRDRVKPKLTPAGERMLWHMEQIMRQYDALIELSRAQNSQGGEITIGVMEAGLTDSARDILRRYSAEYPAMHVNFREVSEIEVFDLLLAGKLDCAIVAHFPELYRGALGGQIIEKYRICAVLNREHPLAGRAMISVKELKEEPFVIVDEEKSALGYRAVTSLCLKSGFSPRIARKEGSVAMALSAVDLNYGCMILIDSLSEMAGRNTVFVPLEGVEEGQIWLVKKRGGSNAAMENFMVFLDALS